jgi:hypothetical protein
MLQQLSFNVIRLTMFPVKTREMTCLVQGMIAFGTYNHSFAWLPENCPNPDYPASRLTPGWSTNLNPVSPVTRPAGASKRTS